MIQKWHSFRLCTKGYLQSREVFVRYDFSSAEGTENLLSVSLQVKYQHVSKGKQREAETRQTADWQGLPTLRRVCGTGGAGQSCTVFS